ncbi:hypothetical protein D9613_009400 [Agrocybe pediades]|uniref:Uncharacterized protein n=1 Tax=Agrocybe pediades TaxID=84607 RepID=A0A8H4VTP2_9AGAR|nr:hypothetical protein D9613_009400 [Agrocybe pediades]
MSYTWNIPRTASESKKDPTTKKDPWVLEDDRYPAVSTQRCLQDIPHTNVCSTKSPTGKLARGIDASTRELVNVRHRLEQLRGCWKIMRRSLNVFLGKDAVQLEGSRTKQSVLTTISTLGKKRPLDEMDAEATRPRFKRRRLNRSILPVRRQTSSNPIYHPCETFSDLESDNSFIPSQSSDCDSDDTDQCPTSLLSPTTDYAAPYRKSKLTNQRMPQCTPRPNGFLRFKMDNSRIDFNPETRKYEVIRDPDLVGADAYLEDLLDTAPLESVFRTVARTLDTTYELVVLEDYFEVPITPENNIITDGDPDYPSFLRNQPIPEFNEIPEGFTVPVDADGNVDLTLLYRQP